MRWGSDMDISLREFIAMRVGETEVVPPWVYTSITELKEQVASLQGGKGITIKVPDMISLNIAKSSAMSGLIDSVIVPKAGTVQGFYGFANTTHTSVKMKVVRTSTTLPTIEKEYQVTSNPQYLNLSLEAADGDILSFYLYGEGAPTTEPEPTEPPTEEGGETPTEPVEPTEPTPDFTDVTGSFLIKLPAVTYTGSTS